MLRKVLLPWTIPGRIVTSVENFFSILRPQLRTPEGTPPAGVSQARQSVGLSSLAPPNLTRQTAVVIVPAEGPMFTHSCHKLLLRDIGMVTVLLGLRLQLSFDFRHDEAIIPEYRPKPRDSNKKQNNLQKGLADTPT